MVCNFEVTQEELEKALLAIKKAKENGFETTTSIFHISSVNEDGTKVFASFSNCIIMQNEQAKIGNVNIKMIDWYNFVDGHVIET